MLTYLKDLMNDSDRGPGHGLAQGMFWGFLFLPLSVFSLKLAVTVVILNYTRVAYQELITENWKSKAKTGDFWYDCIFRPSQAAVVFLGIGYLPVELWGAVVLLALVVGFKKKNEWPLLIFWR